MQTDTTTTRLSRAEVEEILRSPNEDATYPPLPQGGRWTHYPFCMHADTCNTDEYWAQCDFSFCVCWNPTKRLALDALAYMTALEKAEKDISFALGSVLTDAALLEDLREEIRKVLL